MSIQAKWFAACLADWQNSAGQAPDYADVQLSELRESAALIIAGEYGV